MPIGIVAGKAELLDALDGGMWQYGDASFPGAETTFVAGTFCKHPLSLAAARAVLQEIQKRGPGLHQELNQRTSAFAADLNAWFADARIPVQMVHFGSLFRFAFQRNQDLLFYHLMERGVYIWEGRNCFFSTAHTDEDVAYLRSAIHSAVGELQEAGFLAGKRVQDRVTRTVDSTPDTPVEIPLSADQRHLWIMTQMGTAEALAYNVPTAIELEGPLDVGLLKQAIQQVVDRHDMLRTTVSEDGSTQRIAPAWPIELPVTALNHLHGEAQQEALQRFFEQLSQRPFDFTAAPAVIVRLVRLDQQRHVLCVLVHHLMMDGWSVANILQEVGRIYSALGAGKAPDLTPPLQFRDYLRFTDELRASGARATQQAFWRNKYLGSLPVLDLPTDRRRPALKTCNGARAMRVLPPSLLARVKELSRRQGATVFMTLLTGYQLLLHRLTRQGDVVVGIPAAARSFRGSDSIVGYCGNLLPIRSILDEKQSFADALLQTRRDLFDAYEHQDYSLAQLIELLDPPRDPSRATIVENLFNFEPPVAAPALGALKSRFLPQPIGATALDISVNVVEIDAQLVIYCDYNTDLFVRATIERWLEHYQTLLQGAVDQPERPAMLLPLMTDAQLRLVVDEWNATDRQLPLDRDYSQLFEAQVERSGDALAVIDERERFTYRQLNARANRLARRLQDAGVAANRVVALFGERSCAFLAAILGIFKAGGAYLPLDLQHPPQRLAQVLSQSQSLLVLVERARRELLEATLDLVSADGRPAMLVLEDILDGDGSAENLLAQAAPDDLAYVLFTSGSTGLPKGAMIEQRGMVNHLYAKIIDLDLRAGDIVAQNARQSFDISVWQLLVALLAGGCTRIYDDETARDPELLLRRVDEEGVTILEVVPSLLGALLQGLGDQLSHLPRLATLRWLLLTGEALPPQLCREWFVYYPRIPLLNAYGPTECSDDVSHEPISEPPADHVVHMPIGRPVVNTQLYVLDDHLQPVPIGVPGELYVGGVGVGRGYRNAPELTQAVFLTDPFRGGRFYRTGDLARYLPDGRIEYLGRIDHQVKIRGFRIELGEIEVALSQHRAVRQSVVVAREDQPRNKRLVAYVVLDHDDAGSVAAAERLEQWQQVWQDTYGQLGDQGDGALDTIGWNDSYTRQPFLPEVMREWVDASVRNLLELQPERVLELGCGTGMLLTRIAPYCLHYRGHDISARALDYVRASISRRSRPWRHVELAQFPAHDVSAVEPRSYDTVVINSVAQYFPSVDYLVQVLEQAVEAVAAGGRIYVGDVRDLRLQEALHASVELFDAADELSRSELVGAVIQHRDHDQELLLEPAFFLALQARLPRISHVQMSLKRGADQNELTRFRYDVVLHIERPSVTLDAHFFHWDAEELDLGLVRQVLDEGNPACLGVADVPNARLLEACHLTELIHAEEAPETAGALRQALAGRGAQGVDPEAWHHLGAGDRYHVLVTIAGSGARDRYDVLFYHKEALAEGPLPAQHLQLDSDPKPFSAYASRPSASSSEQRVLAGLDSFLADRLPEYMIPEAYVVLQEMPLTPNGKIDRKALPAPEGSKGKRSAAHVAPRTAVEERVAAIFGQVLGLTHIGVHDDFFELGGHSLTGTQVIARIRSELEIELSLRNLFEAPTVAGLSEHVAERGSRIEAPLGSILGTNLTARQRTLQRVNVDQHGFGSLGSTSASDER
jgi:amino acid adenylation domain-containing protein